MKSIVATIFIIQNLSIEKQNEIINKFAPKTAY